MNGRRESLETRRILGSNLTNTSACSRPCSLPETRTKRPTLNRRMARFASALYLILPSLVKATKLSRPQCSSHTSSGQSASNSSSWAMAATPAVRSALTTKSVPRLLSTKKIKR